MNIQIDEIVSFNILNERVKAHVENERTEKVTLEYSSSDWKDRGITVVCNDECPRISVQSTN